MQQGGSSTVLRPCTASTPTHQLCPDHPLCSAQEHVRGALPTVLQMRRQLQQTAATATAATHAADHSREFAAGMRAALPASLSR